MAYIHKNVNMYLLFLILLTATSLVGATVVFQQKFNSMVSAYDGQISQMNGLAEELNLKQSALQDAEKNLRLREAREEKLNQINEKLASAVSEPQAEPAQPTGAVSAGNTPRQLYTSTGGITARPRRAGYATMLGF